MIFHETIAVQLSGDKFSDVAESLSDCQKWVNCPVWDMTLNPSEGIVTLYFLRDDVLSEARSRFGIDDIAKVRSSMPIHPDIQAKTDDEIRILLLMSPGFAMSGSANLNDLLGGSDD